MADPDELYPAIKIYGKYFDSFTALHTFIRTECPGKLADFQQKYGKHSSSYHSNLFLDQSSFLNNLYRRDGSDGFDTQMADFKKQNNCNIPGARLMISLQGDKIPVPETVVVINLLVSLC
jgi:hypothetical protein